MNEENKNQEKKETAHEPQPEKPEKAETKPEKAPEAKIPEKKQRPKECSSCGKSIDKQWYYREDNYYCGKGCWKKRKLEARDKAGQNTETKK